MSSCGHGTDKCLRRGLMTATGTAHVPGHPGRGRRSTYQVCVPQLKRMTSAGPPDRQITDSSLPAQMACRSSFKIRGAGALDVEAPDRAAPARVPPAVNDRARNLDGPRGGCQAGLVQLQVLVSGIADDQGDRDHALGHGIAPSWCAAARRLLRRHEPEHETAVLPARDVRRSEACSTAAASSPASSGETCSGCGSRSARPAASVLVTSPNYRTTL